MNRKAYSKAYNESKQVLKDSIKRFANENPQRFAELQVQAKHEIEHPTPRVAIRYPIRSNLAELIRREHTQSYYIHTKDTYGDEHLYFESLDNETPEGVLTRRHSKFLERSEKVTKVEKCTCPLCLRLN